MYTLNEYIKATELWHELGDIPMNPETECIEVQWHNFPSGTHREDIWHWIEDTYHVPVYNLMFPAQLVDTPKMS